MNQNHIKHRVIFEPFKISSLIYEGWTVFDAATTQGIAIRSECGGKGRCGKCLILANPAEHLSPISSTEREILTGKNMTAGFRLACMAKILGPVTVTIPTNSIASLDASGKTDIEHTYPLNPAVERLVLSNLQIPQPIQRSSIDVIEQTVQRTKISAGTKIFFHEHEAICELSQSFNQSDEITIVNHKQKGVTAVLGGKRNRSLGIAADLGTTTIAVFVCDLQKGLVLSSAAATNPQRSYGEDVISRICFTHENAYGTKILQDLIVGQINALIGLCLAKIDATKQDIDEAVMVGNTTMQHIILGINPYSIGISPYLPVFHSSIDIKAKDIGLDLNPGTNVHIFPVISGFVGGDTMGAIISERPHENDRLTMIVDIGTNGEIVLGSRDGLWATSCATGPALEGAHITCGMRATTGAIHKVHIHPVSYQVTYEVLGGPNRFRPLGICGSGIIDIAASMGRTGLLLSSGLIKAGMPGVVCDQQGLARKFVLVSQDKTATGDDIFITLSDIRQIQLAKGALFAGIKLLMRKAKVNHIEKLVLTGAFGAKFDLENAVYIGMLPKISANTEIKIVENAAGTGAVKALLNRMHREEASNLAKCIKVLELASEPDFNVEFPNALHFPFENCT